MIKMKNALWASLIQSVAKVKTLEFETLQRFNIIQKEKLLSKLP